MMLQVIIRHPNGELSDIFHQELTPIRKQLAKHTHLAIVNAMRECKIVTIERVIVGGEAQSTPKGA